MAPSLNKLNSLPPDQALAAFNRCCGSATWAMRMTDARPFTSIDQLFAVADSTWQSLTTQDHLEAFSHHPRIGDTRAPDAKFDATRAWSQGEQRGVADAAADTRDRLARGNEAYFDKFGFVFLICATGKSAAEMLSALEQRLGHARETELAIAAEQQRLITRLRLEKLLAEP